MSFDADQPTMFFDIHIRFKSAILPNHQQREIGGMNMLKATRSISCVHHCSIDTDHSVVTMDVDRSPKPSFQPQRSIAPTDTTSRRRCKRSAESAMVLDCVDGGPYHKRQRVIDSNEKTNLSQFTTQFNSSPPLNLLTSYNPPIPGDSPTQVNLIVQDLAESFPSLDLAIGPSKEARVPQFHVHFRVDRREAQLKRNECSPTTRNDGDDLMLPVVQKITAPFASTHIIHADARHETTSRNKRNPLVANLDLRILPSTTFKTERLAKLNLAEYWDVNTVDETAEEDAQDCSSDKRVPGWFHDALQEAEVQVGHADTGGKTGTDFSVGIRESISRGSGLSLSGLKDMNSGIGDYQPLCD